MGNLTNMTLPELAKHYNGLVEEALKRGLSQFEIVKRFPDKPSAMRRIAKIRVMVGIPEAEVDPLVGVDLSAEVQSANERINKKPKPVVHLRSIAIVGGVRIAKMRPNTKQAHVLR